MRKKNNNDRKSVYSGLHGQELIDAINKDFVTVGSTTESQKRVMNKIYAKEERMDEIKFKIQYFLMQIFFTPLGILFHILMFIFRIVGGIASAAMIYGLYCAYKAFVAWRAGADFATDARTAAILIVAPFIAFGLAAVCERLWDYFDMNKF